MNDIVRQLQQRIDKRSNYITVNRAKYEKEWKPAWQEIIREHTLDKRIMGELIVQERDFRIYRKLALELLAAAYND